MKETDFLQTESTISLKFSTLKQAAFTTVAATLNSLLPPQCIQCRCVVDAHQACCEQCYATLPFQYDCCSRCGQAFTGINGHCGRCIQAPPPFDECYAAFRYEGVISDQIHALKYQDRPDYAARLAKIWAKEIDAMGLRKPQLLLPVPVHISRLRSRGYNQAALLAQHLAKQLQLPADTQTLKKSAKSLPQASLTLKQRQTNLKGCFELAKPVNAKHIAIIDDVYTTGATAAELSRVLRKAGVERIQVWTLAHTM